jgi:hypothetical protein
MPCDGARVQIDQQIRSAQVSVYHPQSMAMQQPFQTIYQQTLHGGGGNGRISPGLPEEIPQGTVHFGECQHGFKPIAMRRESVYQLQDIRVRS